MIAKIAARNNTNFWYCMMGHTPDASNSIRSLGSVDISLTDESAMINAILQGRPIQSDAADGIPWFKDASSKYRIKISFHIP